MIHLGKTELEINIKYTKAIPLALFIILYHLFGVIIVVLDAVALITPAANNAAATITKYILYTITLYLLTKLGYIILKIMQYKKTKKKK